MAFVLFLVCILNFFILGARGISMASKLKEQIGYTGSSLNLYYSIQNQAFSNSDHLVPTSNPDALILLRQCKQNIRLMAGIGFVCIIALFPFA
jgi:hypothetical protein